MTRHTNLWRCVATFKTFGATLKRHQEYQKNFSQLPFVIRQLELAQFLRIIVDKALNGLTEKHRDFEHEECRVPANSNIQRNGHWRNAVELAILDKCFPKENTSAKLLGNPSNVGKSSEETVLISINKIFEELIDNDIDDMCDATDVMFLMIPDNTVTIEKESFQALTQRSVVAGIVSRDAKQIIGDVVLFENLMDNFGKIGTSVTSINLFESKERLMKAKLFVDIMRSNTYTGLVNINRSDGMRCNPEKMSRLPITLERCTQECNMSAS